MRGSVLQAKGGAYKASAWGGCEVALRLRSRSGGRGGGGGALQDARKQDVLAQGLQGAYSCPVLEHVTRPGGRGPCGAQWGTAYGDAGAAAKSGSWVVTRLRPADLAR